SIFLDASTTSLFIAKLLGSRRIAVVTNSIKITNALVENPNVHLVVIGGSISARSMSALGRNAEQNMNRYYFDKAFISCRSVSMQQGITDSNEQQAEIRRLAIERANQAYLVADITKFNRASFASIAGFEKINAVVVDEHPGDEWRTFLDDLGVELAWCGYAGREAGVSAAPDSAAPGFQGPARQGGQAFFCFRFRSRPFSAGSVRPVTIRTGAESTPRRAGTRCPFP